MTVRILLLVGLCVATATVDVAAQGVYIYEIVPVELPEIFSFGCGEAGPPPSGISSGLIAVNVNDGILSAESILKGEITSDLWRVRVGDIQTTGIVISPDSIILPDEDLLPDADESRLAIWDGGDDDGVSVGWRSEGSGSGLVELSESTFWFCRSSVSARGRVDTPFEIATFARMHVPGDFDLDGLLTANDADELVQGWPGGNSWFDLTGDGFRDQADVEYWVHELANTYFGDANVDGEFNSSDLVTVFEAGRYERGPIWNLRWSQGDWNGDRRFDTGDLVLAFVDGGYEQGPRVKANAVPEPNGIGILAIAMAVAAVSSTRRRGRRS